MIKINSKNVLRIIIIGLGIILVIIALGIYSSKVASQNKSAETLIKIDSFIDPARINSDIVYIINKGEGQGTLKMDYVLRDGEQKNVFDILRELSIEKNFELKYSNNIKYGIFVESIVDIKNGDDGKYWQYYIDDKLGDVAADKKEVKAGDKIEWRFEKVPEF